MRIRKALDFKTGLELKIAKGGGKGGKGVKEGSERFLHMRKDYIQLKPLWFRLLIEIKGFSGKIKNFKMLSYNFSQDLAKALNR